MTTKRIIPAVHRPDTKAALAVLLQKQMDKGVRHWRVEVKTAQGVIVNDRYRLRVMRNHPDALAELVREIGAIGEVAKRLNPDYRVKVRPVEVGN
ncbi:MAG: hypothetical protein ACREDU_04720 [Methylocella sp.]